MRTLAFIGLLTIIGRTGYSANELELILCTIVTIGLAFYDVYKSIVWGARIIGNKKR